MGASRRGVALLPFSLQEVEDAPGDWGYPVTLDTRALAALRLRYPQRQSWRTSSSVVLCNYKGTQKHQLCAK